MAKAKTTKKKKKTAKKTAKKSSRAASSKRTTKKKTTTKKTAKKKSAKKPASKKKTTKKKSAKKKVVKRAGKKKTGTTRKKTAKKSSTKKSAGKATSKKKTTAKKTSSKKKSTRKKVASKSETQSAASGASGDDAKPAKKKKKRQSKVDARKRGRSVAEVASSEAADEQGYVFINGRRVRMISTAGKVFPKRPKVAPAAEQEVEVSPAKFGKTKLSKKELNYYRGLLLIKRGELVGDLSAMEAAALRSSGGELSHMPIHMADIGSDTYEQDFTLGLAENERQHLREIDEALQRIEDRIYGVCQMTGKDIPKARLEAKPWAKYTIEAARIVESQTQQR